MIRKLKRQITFALTVSFFVILLLIIFLINFSFYAGSANSYYSKINRIIDRINYQSLRMTVDPRFASEYRLHHAMLPGIANSVFGPLTSATFEDSSAVFIDKNDKLTIFANNTNGDKSDEWLAEVARSICSSKHERGIKYEMFYVTREYPEGKLVVLSGDDTLSKDIKMLRSSSIIIGTAGIVIMAWGASFMAGRIIVPIKESTERERSFISDISHELKTPLAVINSNAEALESDIGENKWINCIKSESIRMSLLVNDLMVYSRLDKNTNRDDFVDVDVSSCLEEIVMNFEAPAFEKGVLIDDEIEEGLVVPGDNDRLKQLFAILLDNAVKYVDKDGKIEVQLKKGHVSPAIVTIKNTGSYIDKQQQKRIFDRFYRTDESRSKEEAGKTPSYGLGLAIAQRIAENHAAELSVSSSKEEGTTFKVAF